MKTLFTVGVGGGLFGVIVATLTFPTTVGRVVLGLAVLSIPLSICVFFARELYDLLFNA